MRFIVYFALILLIPAAASADVIASVNTCSLRARSARQFPNAATQLSESTPQEYFQAWSFGPSGCAAVGQRLPHRLSAHPGRTLKLSVSDGFSVLALLIIRPKYL